MKHHEIGERMRHIIETHHLIEHVLSSRQRYSLELARFDLQFALEFIGRSLEAKLSELYSKAM